MPKCERCGAELQETNPGGRYREKCMDCIEEIASTIPSHFEQCEDDDCLTCNAP